MSDKKQGYASYKRSELFKILKPVLGKIVNIQTGKKADVLITVKESLTNGHRIYSIELDEINKASERFEGLSDAAETNSEQGN
jgi:hypothetical protein